jgi:hypothetical protein
MLKQIESEPVLENCRALIVSSAAEFCCILSLPLLFEKGHTTRAKALADED